MKPLESQQVSWWSVHEHVQPFLDLVGAWPTAGTPAWCALPDGPVKLAALLDAAQHHALRFELGQEARAEASRAVSGALNWNEVSRETLARTDFYTARPWLRRAAS
ncbi:DUF2742 domain-containing protein [Mycobacterium intracellulare]|uniref:DUF2742 domain-containing protein n=1 Tax=Mycobacterium intracellulare TaxID=1767 RepID=UPI001CD9BAEA|nr:DUF2742 domain-containing protein [Mycobacterium intracellulare]MCA2249028.1 DUF2742 domain-containing protein [Mycobacterium intracellulare]